MFIKRCRRIENFNGLISGTKFNIYLVGIICGNCDSVSLTMAIAEFQSIAYSGIFRNIGLVLVGVKGNARLGTTVNVMLGWICTVGILEGTFGLLAKCLILGKLLIVFCYYLFASLPPT